MIELYYAPPSIYGRKVLAVLDEKGLDYEIKKMSFVTRDQQNEAYLKLNPNGEIPTLVDEGFVVYESTAIIEYLNDEYPEPPLMPEDSAGRARVRMVEDYCDLHFYPDVVKCFIKKVLKHEELTDADKAPLSQHLKRIENYLGKQDYAAGKFSLADCAVMPAFVSLEAFGLQNLIAASKALQTYTGRLKQRPGYKGAGVLSFETVPAGA